MSVGMEDMLGIGKDPHEMSLFQMCMRGIVIFFGALVLIRIADKRFLANRTGFDLLFTFILGSSLSRGINGGAPLLNTLGLGLVIVLLHRALAKLAAHSLFFCRLMKGRSQILIKDGQLQRDVLSKNDITEDDIHEDFRLHGVSEDFRNVREARIERNGEISVIPLPNNQGQL